MATPSAAWADVVRQGVDSNLQAIQKINRQVRHLAMQPASCPRLAVLPR